MNEEDIRLECLRIALATVGESSGRAVLDVAREYYAWVMGRDYGATITAGAIATGTITADKLTGGKWPGDKDR